MHYDNYWPLGLLPALFFTSSLLVAQPPALRVEVFNIQANKGKLVVELYKEKSEWLKSPFRRTVLTTDATAKTAAFEVPPGRYAVSVYQGYE